MDNFNKGIGAGFIASFVLALIMAFQMAAGVMPELDIIALHAALAADYAHMPAVPLFGWLVHFAVGTILWGGLFGAYNHLIPGDTELGRGVTMGVVGWAVSMLLFMPAAGAGFFGVEIGAVVPLMSLVMHTVFGIVLGLAYAALLHIKPTRQLPVYPA